MSKHDACILGFIGASGSGKSQAIKEWLRKHRPARLLIWDRMREYGPHGLVVASLTAAYEATRGQKGPLARFAIVYQPPGAGRTATEAAFSAYCKLALSLPGSALVAEELAFVTTASRAPAGWREVTLTGRHEGLKVLGASQRPASIDKDFFGNCTALRCGRLNYARDVRTMADVLAVQPRDITNLQPLQFIERDMRSGATRRGVQRVFSR